MLGELTRVETGALISAFGTSGHCAAEFQCPLLGVKQTWFRSRGR